MNVIQKILTTKAYRNIMALKKIKTEVPEMISNIDLKYMNNNDLLNKRDEIIQLLRTLTKDISYQLDISSINSTGYYTMDNNSDRVNSDRIARILDAQPLITTLEHRPVAVNSISTPAIQSNGIAFDTEMISRFVADDSTVSSRSSGQTYTRGNVTH